MLGSDIRNHGVLEADLTRRPVWSSVVADQVDIDLQLVFVTSVDDGNCNVILETVSQGGSRFSMVQKYVPEIVDSGDKRIILVDGEPIPLALVRLPPECDHRGNLATGARAEVRELTDRDRWICERVGPVLREKGLLFTGIDVIGDFMTEINVTSPTGIRELERLGDVRVAEALIDAIGARADRRPTPSRPTDP